MGSRTPSVERDEEDLRSMSVQQLARATADGRKVTLHIFDADPVSGYLAAIDSKFFLMLVPDAKSDDGYARRMVARDKITLVDLHDDATLLTEPSRNAMEQIIAPFRSWVMRKVLGRQESLATPRKVG